MPNIFVAMEIKYIHKNYKNRYFKNLWIICFPREKFP